MRSVRIEGVKCIAETDKACLCEVDGDEHWISKSTIDDSEVFKDGDEGDLVVSEWLALQKGFL